MISHQYFSNYTQEERVKDVVINCEDGVEIFGTIYVPTAPKAAILIAPATGIKRRFYHGFAQFLAQNNYVVLTFDNRGIVDSKGKSINDFDPSIVNWGKYDMTGALEKLKFCYPEIRYHLVGHSAGGQIFGLMQNASDISSIMSFFSKKKAKLWQLALDWFSEN